MREEPPFTFYDAYVGPQAGSFELETEHTVKHTDEDKKTHTWTGEATLAFSVAAPRLALPSRDAVHACYPPVNAAAPFEQTTPHVTFGRRSLPWERPMRQPSKAGVVTPWLALLVLRPEDQADAVLRTVEGKALAEASDEVYSPWSDGVLSLDADEEKLQVSVLEMEAARFHGLCPGVGELPLLASVRRVSMARKEGGGDEERDFSLLLANRFPAEGLNTAVVVSLEGWQAWLGGGARSKHARVRVVALHAWQFHSRTGKGTCAQQVHRLRARALTFTDKRLGKVAGNGAELQAVRGALKLGYSPIAYQPARGERTFAWYRGPLAPVQVRPFADGVDTFVKADAALVVDETTGMVDLSYTSAWQLGQLLALSASSFGAAARTVSQGMYQAALRRAENDENKTPATPATPATPGKPGKPAKPARTLADEMSAYLGERASRARAQAQGAAPPRAALPSDEPLRIMAHWLAALSLLEPVPLRYLVPSKKLLPEGSLRVFHVDPRWVDALTDGALSVGATSLSERKALHSKQGAMRRVIRRALLDQRPAASQGSQQAPPALDRKGFEAASAEAGSLGPEPEPMCGFLLRSRLLADFPGIEIEIRDSKGAPLPVRRMDRIAEGVLMVLALGVPDHILVREPREGLRFGAAAKGAGFALAARKQSGTASTDDPHAVPMREGGVVDVKALADAMGAGAWLGIEASGALYALQWIHPPQDVTIPWSRGRDLATWTPAVTHGGQT